MGDTVASPKHPPTTNDAGERVGTCRRCDKDIIFRDGIWRHVYTEHMVCNIKVRPKLVRTEDT